MNKKNLIRVGAVVLIATGLFAAQQGVRRHAMGGHMGHFKEFAARYLDLTDAQKTQAQAIFDAAKQPAQAVAEQLKQGHDAMRAAMKAGKSDAELQQLAERQGALVGQLAAVHSKAFARFYATLTPQQKEKADTMHDFVRERIRSRFSGTTEGL
ncbi:MAG: Spy/CpxP family protein refolding chaperone [Bryobacteraceae bacterium]